MLLEMCGSWLYAGDYRVYYFLLRNRGRAREGPVPFVEWFGV